MDAAGMGAKTAMVKDGSLPATIRWEDDARTAIAKSRSILLGSRCIAPIIAPPWMRGNFQSQTQKGRLLKMKPPFAFPLNPRAK